MGRFKCWRLSRAHHTINVNKGLFSAIIAVSCERIAKMWTNIDVINAQNREFADIIVSQYSQNIFRDFIASLSQNNTRIQIDKVCCHKTAQHVRFLNTDESKTGILNFTHYPRGQLCACLGSNFTCFCIHKVSVQFDASITCCVELTLPAITVTAVF